jgi:hydrogenase maturation protease
VTGTPDADVGIRDSKIGIRGSGFGVRGVKADPESEPESLERCDVQHGVLVLCLGNDILRDDGVAWAVADQLETSLPESRTTDPESRACVVKRSALSGFYLLDELTGWDRVLVVDAVRTGQHPPGTVLSFPFEALGTEEGPSPHAAGLPTVIRLGRRSGVPLPSWIHIVAIEADDMESFVEGLTPAVEAAVPEAVAVIRSVLAGAPAPAIVPA